MPDNQNPLQGLVEWINHPPWDEEFHWVLGEHIGDACEEFGIETVDDLEDTLGDVFGLVWGSALEDLMAQDTMEDYLVDAYLAANPDHDSPEIQAYMRAFKNTEPSIYLILEATAGHSFTARDMRTNSPAIRIYDEAASRIMRAGMIVSLRVLQVDGKTMMGRTALPFTAQSAKAVTEALKEHSASGAEDLDARLEQFLTNENEDELDEDDPTLLELADMLTQGTPASIITGVWLQDYLRQESNGSA